MRRRNLLRTKSGQIVTYPDTKARQEWITDGRVESGAEVYDSDRKAWIPVEDHPDFARFFELPVANRSW